jgi:hypothetical protein
MLLPGGGPEKKLESRTIIRDETRGHRQVHLKKAWQQEDTIAGLSVAEIEESDGPERPVQVRGPIVENLRYRGSVGKTKGQVKVRPTIRAAHCVRSNDRPTEDPLILPSDAQNVLSDALAVR